MNESTVPEATAFALLTPELTVFMHSPGSDVADNG